LQSFEETDFAGAVNQENRSEIRERMITQREKELEELEKERDQYPSSALIAARIDAKQAEIDDLQ
jgi:hypothetical protein